MSYLINRVFSDLKIFWITPRVLTLIFRTLWPFLVKFDIMPYMVTITKKNLFVHLQAAHWPARPGKVREKKCIQGKVRKFCFLSKSQGFFLNADCHDFCCFSCRLSRMFVAVFTNMKVYMWIFKIFFYYFQVLHQQHLKYNTDIIWNELFQTLGFVWYIYNTWIDNQLSIKWSWKFLWKSGKSQGIVFFKFLVGTWPCGRKLYRYFCNVSGCFRNTGWSTSICDIWHHHDLWCLICSINNA